MKKSLLFARRCGKVTLLMLAMLALPHLAIAKQWTLQECIDYALSHNITIQKNRISKLSAQEDILQSKAELLPSLNASTSQNVTYNPFPESGRATVANGYVQSSVDKVFYNGSYGVNGNWTVWNGNRNKNAVKLSELAEQQAELDSAITANSIQEQIAQLYVQILYSAEAIKVNKASYETSKANEERGKAFVDVGKMSKSDLAQLTTQRAQDEYNIVEAESNLRNFKRQLKQLLQITNDEEFDIVIPDYTDEMALQIVPAMQEVFNAALDNRPEIKNARLGIATSDLNIQVAKAQKLPTVGLNASAITNTSSMSETKWGSQLKNNFNLGAGVSVSIPLFDNRASRTAVNKAMLQKQNYQLELQDQQTSLYSTIENYWLQAVTNQNKFKAARVATQSAETSYEMLSGKFQEKLINIVELMQGRDAVIQAQQNELQSKYLTILNLNLLNFYKDGQLH
ncbi:MAG: TolC family protein [Prevotella sp.]|nr:TolC family protein [Prevotella sp.]